MLQQQAAAGQGYGIGADYGMLSIFGIARPNAALKINENAGANAYADMEGVALKRQRMEIGVKIIENLVCKISNKF